MEKNGINTQLEERLIVNLVKCVALIQNGGTIQKTGKATVGLGAVWRRQNLTNLSMNKSDCCNAEVVEKEGYEIPKHFICFNCFQPCEIIQEDTNQE